MNVYMDRTFIIDSVNEWFSRYYAEGGKFKDFSQYDNAEIAFINLLNNEKHTIRNVLGVKTNKAQGLIHMYFRNTELPREDSEFYKTNTTDSYGRGNAYHSYGLWLTRGNTKECILRGKALFVKAGE